MLARVLVRAAAALLLVAAIVGLPVALVYLVGWPLPTTLPSAEQLTGWLHSPVSDTMIVNLLAVAAWLLWAAFTHATLVEARAAWRGMPPRGSARRTTNPLRQSAGMLITALTLGTLLSAAATTANPAPARPATTATQVTPTQQGTPGQPPTLTAQDPATIHVGQTSYIYVVEKGDYLSKIAKVWLDDANRWPEICQLNWHRHWPRIGGTLHDCDLIYPGWDLKLPADARPPAEATPVTPQPTEPPTTDPQPTPTARVPADPDGVIEPPVATTPEVPPPVSPTANPATTMPSTTSPTPASPATSAAEDAGADEDPPDSTDQSDGITLPGGSFIPWTLAAAITAAAAWVWLQRRRGALPGDAHDDPPELPPPVTQLQREVAHHPQLAPPADLAEHAAAVPELPLLPAGGVGLVGDGAPAAARAALVSTLASGGPRDPDRRGEVVIDGTTLTTLIGADAAGLGPWPRLHVADDLDHALTIIESRLLHRSRILDDHSLTDLDTLRDRAPDEEALPPVLLISETPPPGARMRARVSLGLGTGLGLCALLLGKWDHGTTLHVTTDGHTQMLTGAPVHAIGERMAVLDTAAATQVLATLREAHTGQPPTITPLQPPAGQHPPISTDSPSTGTPSDAANRTTAPASAEPTPKVRLRVLGTPRIEDMTLPGRPPRAKALELAVYLACHPNGAATRELGEYLNPDARLREADQRVHTNASNLRHVFSRAGGTRQNAYLIKTGGRYRIDPATVEVDLWRLRELLNQATISSGEARRRLVQEACDLYTAPLASGCEYDWIMPYREKVRRWATEAHLLLADELLDTHPQQASDLLDKAINLDRYNEELYRKAMHARHTLGDADGIRTLLRALTKALSDLDAEPTDDTIDLATKLRASLNQQ